MLVNGITGEKDPTIVPVVSDQTTTSPWKCGNNFEPDLRSDPPFDERIDVKRFKCDLFVAEIQAQAPQSVPVEFDQALIATLGINKKIECRLAFVMVVP